MAKEGNGGNNNAKQASEWATISLPKAILLRIEAIYERLGYRSLSEYVRMATLKQLNEDEAKGGPLGLNAEA